MFWFVTWPMIHLFTLSFENTLWMCVCVQKSVTSIYRENIWSRSSIFPSQHLHRLHIKRTLIWIELRTMLLWKNCSWMWCDVMWSVLSQSDDTMQQVLQNLFISALAMFLFSPQIMIWIKLQTQTQTPTVKLISEKCSQLSEWMVGCWKLQEGDLY